MNVTAVADAGAEPPVWHRASNWFLDMSGRSLSNLLMLRR